MSKVILSGMQPSGILHLGNYIGGILNWQKMISENEGSNFYFMLADLHSLTTSKNPDLLRQNIIDTIACYMACGILGENNRNIKIFRQSKIPAHAELSWIFQTITPLGWMERMTQFKDKSQGRNNDSINLGLFSYPALMAADILLYSANYVPVGDDQKQHIELTRDIALKFNREYKIEIFTLPDPIIIENSRIMSLTNGSKKMSKSDASDLSRITLLDSNDDIVKKIKKAKTDSLQNISYDKILRPEISNLIRICSLIKSKPISEIEKECESFNSSGFKNYVTEIIIECISPIREKINQIKANFSEDLIKENEEYLSSIANKKIREVYEIIGLI